MSIIERDLKHIWHPCSQMHDYEQFPPVHIVNAEGSYLYTAEGKPIIDAISSWWCKSLGHKHPALMQALYDQAERFEHIIGANTCSPILVDLSEKLGKLLPNLTKVFYASDGSCAVEIALKMSVHAQQLRGESQRTQFAALENSYHGETLATLAVSDMGIYRDPYHPLLWDSLFLRNIPYVRGPQDPLWDDCSDYWPAIQAQLDPQAKHLAAIIVEPVVQGAGGMLVYSPDLLRRLSAYCQAHGIFLIADEIMTGFGRTGKPFAVNHADIVPDFVCVGKGLTAGYIPMSAVLINEAIYNDFYGPYEPARNFLHSHTHSGNALAASVALATLETYEKEQTYTHVESISALATQHMNNIAQQTGALTNIRHCGAVIAADLTNPQQKPRYGYQLFQHAIQQGAWMRPLGNTLYWVPPLNTAHSVLNELATITEQVVNT